jgi:hypothetical protein
MTAASMTLVELNCVALRWVRQGTLPSSTIKRKNQRHYFCTDFHTLLTSLTKKGGLLTVTRVTLDLFTTYQTAIGGDMKKKKSNYILTLHLSNSHAIAN